MRFHLSKYMRVYNVEDDVAGIICRALPLPRLYFFHRKARAGDWGPAHQGLTLVHFTAQPEPFLSLTQD